MSEIILSGIEEMYLPGGWLSFWECPSALGLLKTFLIRSTL